MDHANISAIFSPSSTIHESKVFLLELDKYTMDKQRCTIPIKTSVGIHPYHVLDTPSLADARQELCALLNDNSKNDHKLITCIGETGLDYSEGFPNREDQLPWWEMQVKLALDFQLPLFVHERLAFQDMSHSLEQHVFLPNREEKEKEESWTSMGQTRIPIIIHCFTGTQQECQYYISKGCFISISGFILRSGPGPEEVRACLRQGIIPLEKLMIETDAPYMGFPTCRDLHFETDEVFQTLPSKQKKRLLKGTYPNVPSSLPKVFNCVSTLINEGRRDRGLDLYSDEYVAGVLRENSIRFFGFDSAIP
jgi:TatD DNase family protein